MSEQNQVKVWDIGVRLFHWSLVALFVISYLSGDEQETLHVWSGYAIIALLVFRIIWGFVGTRYARFSDFVYAPGAVIEYLKSLASGSPKHYLGHNPAGGWMVIALLVSLSLATWSGLKLYAADGHGPLAQDISLIASAYADGREDDDDDDAKEGMEGRSVVMAGENGEEENPEEEYWEDIHELFVNLTLLLVFVHIAGVAVSSYLHGENLPRAMMTGYKKKS